MTLDCYTVNSRAELMTFSFLILTIDNQEYEKSQERPQSGRTLGGTFFDQSRCYSKQGI